MKTAAILLIAFTLPAADWPQFRGPQRTGISQETGLLKEWPKQGPKLLWQLSDIGDGYGPPARRRRPHLRSSATAAWTMSFVRALSVEDGEDSLDHASG